MRDSVPSARYSSVYNVLRLWSISLIPTYRIYRLYDIPAHFLSPRLGVRLVIWCDLYTGKNGSYIINVLIIYQMARGLLLRITSSGD